MRALHDFAAASGLRFRDEALVWRALTHRSYLNERPEVSAEDNERLEFLGDAVLDFLVGEYVFHRFPDSREGVLTNLRAALVRRETLARFAQDIGIGPYLRMGRGEDESGGRERPATLCAAFEALAGALYLDQGMDRVREFILPLLDQALRRVQQEALEKDPKSRLQEWSQTVLHVTPIYRTVGESGPDHAKEFAVEVIVGRALRALGSGPTKQAAEQAAATQALGQLGL
jgi:ribonuclease-3